MFTFKILSGISFLKLLFSLCVKILRSIPILKLLFSFCVINYAFTNITSAEVYFTSEHLIIYGRKDINNFYINTHSLSQLIAHIDSSIEFYKERGTKAPSGHVDKTFSSWLQKSAKVCTSKLKLKEANALSLVNDALPDDVNFSLKTKNRFKRGFKPLGEAIAWVSG